MADAPKLLPTDSLKVGYPKINQAIDNANEAIKPAGSERIAAGAVTNSKIADGSINGPKLTKYAVGTDNIATESVTNSKIANESVSNAKLTKFAVGTDNVATEAITNPKIAPESVSGSKIAPKAVNYTRLAEDTRGIGINTGTLYPLRSAEILNNTLPNPTPTDAHQNVILSVKIMGAKPNKIYAVETVYDGFAVGGTARYGVSFGQFDKQDDGKVDAATYKQVLSIVDATDNTVPITDSIVTKVYDVPNYKLKIVVTYSRDNMGSYKGSRLSYIAGSNYFGCVIHPNSYGFINNCDIDEVNILGDSLSANTQHASKPYHSWVGNWLGAKINNYGISGSTVGSKYDPMSVRYTGMSDTAKVTLVYGGTNDFGRNQPLGTMADRTNDTFYGAMHVLLKGLLEKYPDKKIGFVSMHHFGSYFPETNQFVLTKMDYVKATREVCEYYSIPLLDLYAGGGFNFEIEAQVTLYSVDKLHYNNKGHERLAKLIYEFILRL
ncbi:SGNH/GDSL hydrolase family protein [Bacillus paramycoides]|uniref:SGNH/GDSL hydrolase family protein n=1 Tax=Bacillus paramycoides TaxID=2026194 RepID=UPI002E234F60|nr:SGNH/GDSL hydrolase family protein [Bacillus paramycoides]